MNIKESIVNHFRGKSVFRISTDILFYLLILAVILPFTRKPLMTGMNKAIMMRPSILAENKQVVLDSSHYDWVLQDLEGNLVPFSEFKNELVFLSFWATWCPPCRAELPNIQRLYDSYGERFSMVLASNEDASVLRNFLEQQDFDFPVYRMVESPPRIFQASSIPTSFVITPEGKITVKKTGSARWDGNFFRSYIDGVLEE